MAAFGGMRFDVTYAIKDWFFDRERVKRAVDKQLHSSMWKAGLYTRRAARKSIKYRNLGAAHRKRAKQARLYAAGKRATPPDSIHSKPGAPPFSWQATEPNIKTILYAFSPQKESVVVGPVKLERTHTVPPVPHVLEFGGTVETTEYRFPGQTRWVQGRPYSRRSAGWRNRRPAEVRRRRANVAARPFMNPALEKVAPQFPKLFFE